MSDRNFLPLDTMTNGELEKERKKEKEKVKIFFSSFLLCKKFNDKIFCLHWTFEIGYFSYSKVILKNALKICRKIIKSLQRSSHPQIFCKIGALKKFTKFTENHLWWNLFFKNNAAVRNPATFLKLDSGTGLWILWSFLKCLF